MSRKKNRSVWLCTLLPLVVSCSVDSKDIPPTEVVPTSQQIDYQQMEFIGFVHFTVNTFTDREWGFGDESPEVFNPTEFDADQWVAVAAEVGMKELIITAKHHDGFCLWPSEFTDHSVEQSPWKNGTGDVLRELEVATREHGVKLGFYLSPWDRNHEEYGRPSYLTYYRDQLRELLTGYGPITEVWIDGANGGTGYYGGANEERRIDRATYYEWDSTWAYIKSLQPEVLIFSDAGPDIRWIGNENGFAGETNWSTINTEGIVVGGSDMNYLNTGDSEGKQWVVPLCNTSIRPGWFYHESQDDSVKTVQQLLEVYYKSVGRNCVLLLNVPPDKRGLFHENDISVMREFRRIVDETFAVNVAAQRPVAAAYRNSDPYFHPSRIVDADLDTYWAANDDDMQSELEIDLGEATTFDRILLQEPIRFGQRIAAFSIDARVGGVWRRIASATTVGYKRILAIDEVSADFVRINIEKSLASPALSNFGLYKAVEVGS